MKKVKNSVVTDEEQQELKSQVNEVRITLYFTRLQSFTFSLVKTGTKRGFRRADQTGTRGK
jgi:ribosomal protein L29